MTYDFLLQAYKLTAGTPMKGTLTLVSSHYYAPAVVSHRRFWESVQADTRIDKAVRIPDGDRVTSSMFVRLDGSWWRVEEAQHTTDEDGLPVTNLSLRRWEGDLSAARTD